MGLRRITVTASLCVAFAALAAPAAYAQQDLRSPDTRDAAAAAAQRYTDLRNPDTRDIADRGGVSPKVTVVEVPVASSSAEGGLDWGDAGIGAAAMLGLILLAAAGALAVTHRKGPRDRPATTV
jgi:hypothetical protein